MSARTVIPYDASRDALYRPGLGEDIFDLGPYRSDAALCAEMARAAYIKRRAPAARALARAGFRLIRLVASGGTEAFVAASEERSCAVLAFRGTESDDVRDIGTDIDFLPWRWERGGRVHRGFAKALDDVWTEIEPRIPVNVERVLYTGHSLGAALATLAASRRAPDALLTFGSPMVGNERFAETLDRERHARYQNCADIVARLPEGLPGFTHCGVRHYLDRAGALHVEPDPEWAEREMREAASDYLARHAWRAGSVFTRELADHAPINYVSGALGRRGARVRYRAAG